MLEYVRLLCKHPQFVYIINHRNHDTRANTKAKRRVQNLHRKGNSVKIFYFKALKFVRLLCKIPHKDYKFLKIVNPRPIMGPQEGFKFHHKNIKKISFNIFFKILYEHPDICIFLHQSYLHQRSSFTFYNY